MLPQIVAIPAGRVRHAAVVAVISGLLLAGCSPSEQATAERPVEVAPAPAGPEIQLDQLTEGDLNGAGLSGELACTFSTAGNAPPILFATGIVASNQPAQGIVKVAGHVERIEAPGGFNGLTGNPTFTGQGKTIEITVTGASSGGGESPPRPANLAYKQTDGASSTVEGLWQCGP